MWKVGLVLSCAGTLSWVALAHSAVRTRSVALGGESANEDGRGMRAAIACDHTEAPGRVRCDVEGHVASDESIAWGDVVIVRTPPFATALRGRIGPHDATTRDPSTWRWALALVAHEKGQGEIDARVRLVVCRKGHCAPREATVTSRVTVGE